MKLDPLKLKISKVKSSSLNFQELFFIIHVSDTDILQEVWTMCQTLSFKTYPDELYKSAVYKNLRVSTGQYVPSKFTWGAKTKYMATFANAIREKNKSASIYIGGSMFESVTTAAEAKIRLNDFIVEHKLIN